MKVLLVSGIFAMPEEFRARNLQETTETLLLAGLREFGVTADARGHAYLDDWRGYDVVHLHHLANGCVRLALPQHPAVVFSRHATKAIPWHHRTVLDWTYRRADRVVVSSQYELSRLRELGFAEKTSVIHNAINPEHFTLRRRTAPDGGAPWNLICVGQLVPIKRTHLAIDLLADLLSAGIPARLRLIYQRSTLLDELKSHAARRDVIDFVEFTGATTRAELGRALDESHFLIHTSRSEALPTVVTEAAFAGLPVIAFDVGGIREQLPVSYEVPQIDEYPRLLALVHQRIFGYREVADQFERHGREIRGLFSPSTMALLHVRAYEEALDLRGRHR